MELSARLRVRHEEVLRTQDTWARNREKASISQAEKQHYQRLHEEAQKAMLETVQDIKNQRALVLHSVDDAKAFVKLLPTHFQDRGRLQQVEVFVGLASSVKTSIHRILGPSLFLTNTVYRFDPPAPAAPPAPGAARASGSRTR